MLASKPVEGISRRLRAPSLHVSEPSLNAFDGLYALETLLVGFCILYDDFGPPVDRENQRVAA